MEIVNFAITDCVNVTEDGTIKNLMSQLDLAHKERDAANKMNKETMQLLDK